MVGRLATGFFVINNIDKASRIINVSYSTDSPRQYVDCGRSLRTFTFKGENKTYDYAVADSSDYQVAGTWGPLNNLPVIAGLSRSTSLEGRINIYAAPSSTSTKVSVNTKYILHINTRGVRTNYNAAGGVVGQFQIPPESSDISFTTSEPGTKNFGAPGTPQLLTCESNGRLERELLSKASP
jgi:hypothetical protein